MDYDWKFRHVGFVVRDMDKAVNCFKELGAATFPPETTLDSSTFSYYEVNGQKSSEVHKSRFQHSAIGPDKLDLEFISPVQGRPIYVDFLEQHGEGLHHIAFTVEDLDAETAKLEEKGVPVLTKVKRPTGRGFAYFDFGNVILELVGPVKQ
jgi:catechol 2,3-dioxygenase-like lactoylglutathione lyase family enzyme